jgi:hypothetical protein
MPKYLLALYDPQASMEAFQTMSPEEMQRVIEKYSAWSRRAAQKGLLAGHKLRDGEGRVARRAAGQLRVIDGPFTESKEVLGGVYLIEAATYDEVLALVSDSPHLEYGGTIEIREIEEIGK